MASVEREIRFVRLVTVGSYRWRLATLLAICRRGKAVQTIAEVTFSTSMKTRVAFNLSLKVVLRTRTLLWDPTLYALLCTSWFAKCEKLLKYAG